MKTFITLDKEREIKLSTRAIIKAEKSLHKSIVTVMQAPSVTDYVTILQAALSCEDSNMTLEKVVNLVDDHSNIGVVTTKVSEALQEAFGMHGEDEKN